MSFMLIGYIVILIGFPISLKKNIYQNTKKKLNKIKRIKNIVDQNIKKKFKKRKISKKGCGS